MGFRKILSSTFGSPEHLQVIGRKFKATSTLSPVMRRWASVRLIGLPVSQALWNPGGLMSSSDHDQHRFGYNDSVQAAVLL